jgi:hypothetical protein
VPDVFSSTLPPSGTQVPVADETDGAMSGKYLRSATGENVKPIDFIEASVLEENENLFFCSGNHLEGFLQAQGSMPC